MKLQKHRWETEKSVVMLPFRHCWIRTLFRRALLWNNPNNCRIFEVREKNHLFPICTQETSNSSCFFFFFFDGTWFYNSSIDLKTSQSNLILILIFSHVPRFNEFGISLLIKILPQRISEDKLYIEDLEKIVAIQEHR